MEKLTGHDLSKLLEDRNQDSSVLSAFYKMKFRNLQSSNSYAHLLTVNWIIKGTLSPSSQTHFKGEDAGTQKSITH